ncbi:hypothetical protein GH714_006829 [Hevea brasiliensis]|uniref:Uncharacterized protein n=1 Tax=Hevea brasiliensis TaxID=3981 RepID=A0A6A6LIV0_HEVBR|nr:hypothetical protein GH714_006829 [Hevea brasiliensis]
MLGAVVHGLFRYYWRVLGVTYRGGLRTLGFDSDVATMCQHAVVGRETDVDSNIDVVNDVQCEATINEHGASEENSDGSVRQNQKGRPKVTEERIRNEGIRASLRFEIVDTDSEYGDSDELHSNFDFEGIGKILDF